MSEPTDVYISKHSGGVLEGGLIAIDAVFRHFLNAQTAESHLLKRKEVT